MRSFNEFMMEVTGTHLVLLQVPALDLLVQATGKHVGVAVADAQPSHLRTAADISREISADINTLVTADALIKRTCQAPAIDLHGLMDTRRMG
jgi:hypothetical protein